MRSLTLSSNGLFVTGWAWLLYLDLLMHTRGFQSLRHVLDEKVRCATMPTLDCQVICHAVDLACVFYFKPVLCLQRSVATAALLRSHGWPAELVIGVQLLPFQSHAWVEVDGVVVNDKPYVVDIFQTLDRC